ncbi:hypothetical protein ABBQ32_014022 [Trebouxia sp. C0010 RCD-2024]
MLMQYSVHGKFCLPFRLAEALAFTVCFLLRSQGVLAELHIHADVPKVAIIGGGIGGSFTAYNLRRLLNESIELHVFEGSKIGGRVQSFSYEDHVHEAGASIVFDKNYYVRDAADQMGLKRVPPSGSSEDLFSIYDGSRFVFQQSTWSIVTLWRMLQRYWLTYFTFSAPKQMLQKFLRLYDLQRQGMTFDSPEAFLKELKLYDLTQQSMHDYLKKSLGTSITSKRFATELVAAVNKVNYNQDSGLNAFAGMVSMLPTVVNKLFQIEGGNVQLPKKILEYAHPHMTTANVTHISRLPDGSYTITSQHRDSTQTRGPFTAVVIATPLELSSMQFDGVQLPLIPPRKFQSTVSTFVRGRLNGTYFGVNHPPKGAIMITEHARTPFSAISPARTYADKTNLFKLFSKDPMEEEVLSNIFSQHRLIATFPWYAYPHFHPPEQFAPFRLADGLFYSNALENAASCMEISAISAMNSALLVQKYLNKTSVLAVHASLAAHNNVVEL